MCDLRDGKLPRGCVDKMRFFGYLVLDNDNARHIVIMRGMPSS